MIPADVIQQLPEQAEPSGHTTDGHQDFRSLLLRLLLVTVVATGATLVTVGVRWTSGAGSAADAPVVSPSVLDSASDADGADDGGSTTATAAGLVDVSDIAALVRDSVVTVNVTIDLRGPGSLTGSGSGIILDAGGTVVTNAHVVDGATTVTVTLAGGTTVDAVVVGIDSSQDVAVLDIDAGGLSPIAVGTTDGLEVGQPVIAIGNPLGLAGGPSVTTGIVSAVGRILEESTVSLTGVIQTDAAITEGSSGGALLDSGGRLIGMTTAVGVSSVGVEGIGFAIPVETVSTVVESLLGS